MSTKTIRKRPTKKPKPKPVTLEERLATLQRIREQMVANLNGNEGQILLVEAMIKERDDAEEEKV